MSDTDAIALLLERADRALTSARVLLEAGDTDGATSRAYYAAFYAASALLVRDGHHPATHQGVNALIHREYVQTERLSRDDVRALGHLADLRHLADYGTESRVAHEDAGCGIEDAEHFLAAARALLNKPEPREP